MNETTELNDLNREDEEREDLKREADRDYPKPFEGVVDINKVMAERNELDKLIGKLLDMTHQLEEREKTAMAAVQSHSDLNSELTERLGNFEKLLPMLGDEGKCKACGASIYWVKSKRGKPMPITIKGLSHFADCPEADKFRGGHYEDKNKE